MAGKRASGSHALRNSGESYAVAEHAPNLNPPRLLWARRFSAARTVDSLHSLHSLARHIVEWAKSPNRSGRRRAASLLPARQGEVAGSNAHDFSSAPLNFETQYDIISVFLPIRIKELYMVAVPTTRMSSRGQVVIPEAIRIGCGFGEGTTFTVVAKGNAVMLQAIVAPPRDLFNELARESRAAAKAAGMRPRDITAAIREVHAERRAARAK